MSFRDAPLGAGPESITTIGSMDSGLAPRGAPRNDGGEIDKPGRDEFHRPFLPRLRGRQLVDFERIDIGAARRFGEAE